MGGTRISTDGGAETLIFVTGTSGKQPNIFVSRQKIQSQLCIPREPRKIGVRVSGAGVQTSAVDTTAVWVSTAEKNFKIVLGKTGRFSRKFRVISAPALYKSPAANRTPNVCPIKPNMLILSEKKNWEESQWFLFSPHTHADGFSRFFRIAKFSRFSKTWTILKKYSDPE